jgi:hypothetical protein
VAVAGIPVGYGMQLLSLLLPWLNSSMDSRKDLPSGKNISNYIDEGTGRVKLLLFFEDHKKQFPTLWVIVQQEASRRVTEVGCNQSFNLSGYISSL